VKRVWYFFSILALNLFCECENSAAPAPQIYKQLEEFKILETKAYPGANFIEWTPIVNVLNFKIYRQEFQEDMNKDESIAFLGATTGASWLDIIAADNILLDSVQYIYTVVAEFYSVAPYSIAQSEPVQSSVPESLALPDITAINVVLSENGVIDISWELDNEVNPALEFSISINDNNYEIIHDHFNATKATAYVFPSYYPDLLEIKVLTRFKGGYYDSEKIVTIEKKINIPVISDLSAISAAIKNGSGATLRYNMHLYWLGNPNNQYTLYRATYDEKSDTLIDDYVLLASPETLVPDFTNQVVYVDSPPARHSYRYKVTASVTSDGTQFYNQQSITFKDIPFNAYDAEDLELYVFYDSLLEKTYVRVSEDVSYKKVLQDETVKIFRAPSDKNGNIREAYESEAIVTYTKAALESPLTGYEGGRIIVIDHPPNSDYVYSAFISAADGFLVPTGENFYFHKP
jgi:hypothetical protein